MGAELSPQLSGSSSLHSRAACPALTLNRDVRVSRPNNRIAPRESFRRPATPRATEQYRSPANAVYAYDDTIHTYARARQGEEARAILCAMISGRKSRSRSFVTEKGREKRPPRPRADEFLRDGTFRNGERFRSRVLRPFPHPQPHPRSRSRPRRIGDESGDESKLRGLAATRKNVASRRSEFADAEEASHFNALGRTQTPSVRSDESIIHDVPDCRDATVGSIALLFF